MPNEVEHEALALFVRFVRDNPQLPEDDPTLVRVLDAYRRSIRARTRADELARNATR